jgi:hypothetical protein
MLFAGSNLDEAREVFAAAAYYRPGVRLTIHPAIQDCSNNV